MLIIFISVLNLFLFYFKKILKDFEYLYFEEIFFCCLWYLVRWDGWDARRHSGFSPAHPTSLGLFLTYQCLTTQRMEIDSFLRRKEKIPKRRYKGYLRYHDSLCLSYEFCLVKEQKTKMRGYNLSAHT